MYNLVCGVVFGVIAYVTYTQSRKSKESDQMTKAKIWMLASLITGVIAVLGILGGLFGG